MDYRLQDLIDIEQFQLLQDRLNEIYSFPSAIIDNDGNILTATAWQDICTEFHRQNPECKKECIKSDQYILSHIAEANPAVSYRCPHGLVDNATPIIVDGMHLGNFFTGQFFLEPPDLELFRAQAKKYGFDEKAYLEAVKKVPVWTPKKLDNYLLFIKGLIEIISETGLKNLKAIEAQQKSEDSEKQFKAMFDIASIGMAQADPHTGQWVRVNQKLCDITGYTAEEMLALRIPEITHPEDRAQDWEAFQRVVQGQAADYRLEKRYIRKDGTVVWVNVNMTVIRDEAGQPVRTMATIENITDRNRVEKALRESENNLAAVINASPESAFLIDAQGLVITCNPISATRIGKRPEEIIGHVIYDFLPPDIAATRRQHVERVVQYGKPVNFEDVRRGRVLSHYLHPVLDAHGQVKRVAVFGHDITEYKNAEAHLKRQNDLLASIRQTQSLFILGHEPREVYREALQILVQTTGSAFGFLDEVLHDDDGTPYKLSLAMSNIAWDEASRRLYEQLAEHKLEFRNLNNLAGMPVVQRQTIIANDVLHHPGYQGIPDGHPPLYNYMGIPLFSGNEIIGVAGVANRPGGYTDEIAESIKPLTQACATMIWASRILRHDRESVVALKASESRYRRIVETANEGIWAMDRDHRTTFVNEHMARMLGREPADILGQPVEDFMFAEDLPVHRERMARRHGGQSATYQHRFRRPDDSAVWTLVSATSVMDAQGEFDGSFAMFTDITPRKQAEDALRESQGMLRHILNTIPQSVFWKDQNGVYLGCNQVFAKAIGLNRPEDVVGKTDADLPWTKAEAEAYRADDQYVITNNTTKRHIIEQIRQADGTYIWADTCKLPLRDGNGNVCGVLGVYEDITERKRAEEALRFQALVLDQIQDHVTVTDLEGRITYANDAECRTFKCSRDQLIGMSVEDFGDDPARGASQREIIKQTMARGEWRGEVVNYASDGNELILDCRTHIVRDEQGNAVAMCGIASDITERKHVEATLREREERYRELVENANSIIIRMDKQGNVTFFNEYAQRFYGYREEEILGRNVVGSIVPQTDSAGRDLRAMILDIGVHPERYALNENENMLRDGTRVWISWTNKPLFDSAGLVREILCVGIDATARRQIEEEKARLEAQLQQAQKMESVGRLAGGVAHDFNNMLGVILGHSEFLIARGNPTEMIRAGLDEIRKAAERSADLTRQLLAFARKQTVAPKVLDLNETVAAMLKMLQRLIGEHIRLNWRPSACACPVNMDPSQIDQILANLCVNARDAIDDVGEITIETKNKTFDAAYCADHPDVVPGDYVRLSVSDNGCGMDQEMLAQIFEPFFTTKNVGEGTGLGLATVYGAVKQNNGFINVCSERGQGTTFTIYLPQYADRPGQERRKDTVQPALRGHETILLVEDERAVLELTAMLLKQQGYNVLAAQTPGEAMRMAQEHTREIHMVMTDVIMPEMNGRDLTKNLQSIYPRIKRLFMSGYTADVIANHGVLDKDVRFIQKPFSAAKLAAKIRETLDSE